MKNNSIALLVEDKQFQQIEPIIKSLQSLTLYRFKDCNDLTDFSNNKTENISLLVIDLKFIVSIDKSNYEAWSKIPSAPCPASCSASDPSSGSV